MSEETKNKAGWHIDRERGVKGFPFAVCSTPRGAPADHSVVLGCFAYKPHAETALNAIRAIEEAGGYE